MASPTVSEEDIDTLTMPRAVKLCKQHQIALGEMKELDKIKWLLKYHLLCQGKRREEVLSHLNMSGKHNMARREALSSLYEDTMTYAETLRAIKDPVVEELDKMSPDMYNELEKERLKMMRDEAPVLVLGETGSGKSSFINLLLGENILPCSLLSNTHVICEIQYCGDGEKSKARLFKAGTNGGVTEINEADDGNFTEDLARHIQQLDNNKRAVYKLAKIYLPCEILKCGLMIVDSPGIGETKEMTEMVLGYILNAAAFIYVIDSTNAGGMQARVKDIVQKVYRKGLEEQKICRPESAIFVCNKWDEVCSKDRADVCKDTKKKIKDVWPQCAQSQIIPFSTVEAEFIQEKGGIAPKFEKILDSINSLVPIGQEVLVLRGYRFIEQYILRCIHCFETHLSQLELSRDERENKRKDTKDRLKQLKSRVTSFFDEQGRTIKNAIDQIADNLKKFINEKGNLDKVCNFSDSELPKRQTWNEAAIEVRHKVYESLRNLIKDWELKETQFGGLAKEIQDSIEKEFPSFDTEIYQAEKQMTGTIRTPANETEETEIGLVPEFIQNRIQGLSRGTVVALGIGLSPVLLVGIIVRLPVFGIQAFDRFYSKYSLEKEFREAEGNKEKLREVCQKYAQKTVANITDRMNMYQIIEEDMQPLMVYLKKQQERMENQIQSDLDLLKSLKDEDRKDEDIRKVYEPLNAKFKILRERLHHFMLLHLPAQFTSWIKEIQYYYIADIEMSDKVICSGLEADIFEAKSKSSPNNIHSVCVRVVKKEIKANKMRKFLKGLEAYRSIKKETIAKCYGFWNPGDSLGKLHQILEPLQCSLRAYAERVDFQANNDNNCIRTMTQIVSGLDFLHDRKLVHFDLSMDTVAVTGTDGQVKLTNISPQLRVNLEPEVVDGKVRLSRYIHLAPRFFQNKDREFYTATDDMYGVGIIMWELWVGQPVVEIGKDFEIPESYLKQGPKLVPADGQKPRNTKTSSVQVRNSVQGRVGSPRPISSCSESNSGDWSMSQRSSYTDEACECIEDEKWFQKFLATFQPKKTEHFCIDRLEKRAELCTEWWETLQQCLTGSLDAKNWQRKWSRYPQFPPVSIFSGESLPYNEN